MKATLEFNLPDDESDFNFANKGVKYYSALWELDQWLRAKTKYAPDDLSDDKYEAYQECRDQLREIMSEIGVNFE